MAASNEGASMRPPMKNDRLCLTVPTLNDSTRSMS